MRWHHEEQMSVKLIYLAQRNPALRPEQFAQAWREHSALGAGCSNVRERVLGVMQCSRVLDGAPIRGASTAHDGVNLLRLRDLASATAIWNDPETLAIMRPDEPRVFARYVREVALLCRERPVRDAPRGQVCLVGFLRRPPGFTAEGFASAWNGARPAAWLGDGPFAGCVRVVDNEVIEPPPPAVDFDRVCEWWYADADAPRAAFGSHDLRGLLPDPLVSLTELTRSVFVFTRVTHQRP